MTLTKNLSSCGPKKSFNSFYPQRQGPAPEVHQRGAQVPKLLEKEGSF